MRLKPFLMMFLATAAFAETPAKVDSAIATTATRSAATSPATVNAAPKDTIVDTVYVIAF